MIIIPDIHGRDFWKDAVSKREDGEEIVFLGDYLDPYFYEVIQNSVALDNFKEIIEFAKSNDNVILLLGNHDCEYFLGTEKCRTDFDNKEEIKNLFLDNLSLFKLGYHKEINGQKFTFSHSGINKEWLEDRKKLFGKDCTPQNCIDVLNDRLAKFKEKGSDKDLTYALNQISHIRGGDWNRGSIIWADVCETDEEYAEDNATYFVFGHSQQMSEPIIEDNFACLDVRRAFKLRGDENIITDL